MKVIAIEQQSNTMKTIFATVSGAIAGYATLLHIQLPFLSWFNWFHLSDFIIFLIGCLKAGIVGGCSYWGATGAGIVKKKVQAKYIKFKNRNK